MVDPKYIPEGFDKPIREYYNAIISSHGKPTSYVRTHFGTATQKNGEVFFNYLGYLAFPDGYKKYYFLNIPMQVKDKKIKGYTFQADK